MFLRTRYFFAQFKLDRRLSRWYDKVNVAKTALRYAESDYNGLRARMQNIASDLPDEMCLGLNLYADRIEDEHNVIFLSEHPRATVIEDPGRRLPSTYLEIDSPDKPIMTGFGHSLDERRAKNFARNVNNETRSLSFYEQPKSAVSIAELEDAAERAFKAQQALWDVIGENPTYNEIGRKCEMLERKLSLRGISINGMEVFYTITKLIIVPTILVFVVVWAVCLVLSSLGVVTFQM